MLLIPLPRNIPRYLQHMLLHFLQVPAHMSPPQRYLSAFTRICSSTPVILLPALFILIAVLNPDLYISLCVCVFNFFSVSPSRMQALWGKVFIALVHGLCPQGLEQFLGSKNRLSQTQWRFMASVTSGRHFRLGHLEGPRSQEILLPFTAYEASLWLGPYCRYIRSTLFERDRPNFNDLIHLSYSLFL